jgi:hypothetical protein
METLMTRILRQAQIDRLADQAFIAVPVFMQMLMAVALFAR